MTLFFCLKKSLFISYDYNVFSNEFLTWCDIFTLLRSAVVGRVGILEVDSSSKLRGLAPLRELAP